MKDWRAVVPSSAEQIEPGQIRSAQEAVERGKAVPHDISWGGILILAVLAIVYTLLTFYPAEELISRRVAHTRLLREMGRHATDCC